MVAKFYCRHTFTIPQRSHFILAGDILHGRIRPGMSVAIPLANGVSLEAPIHSIGVIDTTEGARVGLEIECRNEDEMGFYKSLSISQQELAVND